MQKFQIQKNDEGKRLDIFLNEEFSDFSRSFLSKLNEDGKVLVNSKKQKNGYKLACNDIVEIEIVKKETPKFEAENIPLDIVYEDDDLIVINKQKGLCVHPAVGNQNHTLVNALMYHFDNLSAVNGKERLGIVHRLDKDTSGLMIVAKNDKAHINLAKQIETKSCKRKYLALVVGSFKEKNGKIEKNLIRSKKNRLKYEVCADFEGRKAITLYKTLEIYKGYSLVEFELKTGRTHQIRVHSSYLGHPVVGDELYGVANKFGIKGQLLTSYQLSFNQPTTNEILEFKIDLPKEFQEIIDKLRKEIEWKQKSNNI